MGRLIRDFFEKIYLQSDIAIGFADLSGRFLDVNEVFLQMTGYSKNDLLLKRYQDITPKEFHSVDEGVVERILFRDETVEYEKEFICKDGTRLSFLLNSVCLRNEKDIPYAFGATIRKLPKHKRRKDDFVDYEDKFHSVLDSDQEVFCKLNSAFYLLYVSPNSESILSYSPSELLGKDIFDYVHHDDLFIMKSIFENSIRDLSDSHCVLRFKSKHRSWLLRECYVNPFLSTNGEASLIINIRKVSDTLKLRKKVQRQGEELRKLDQNHDHRVRDLNILFKVTKAVHQSLDPKEVYRIALDTIIELDNIDMAFMYLVNKNRKEAILETYRNIPEGYINSASKIPRGVGITWKIIESGRLLNVENIQYNNDVGPAGKKLGHHGVLGVPLTIGDKVIGVLYFATYKNRKFDNNEVSLLSSISDQISVAISKANLYEELRKRNKSERIISAITKNVHRSLNVANVFQQAADSIKKHIDNADHVSIYRFENNEAILNSSSDNFDSRQRLHEKFVIVKSGVSWKLLNKRRPVMHSTVNDPDIVLDFAEHGSNMKSYLGLPIRHNNHIIGALHITSLRINAFDIRDIGLLKILLRQIESAVGNAKMADALKESEQKYRDLYENVPAGIYRKSYDGQIIMANSTLVHMLGFCTFDEMITKYQKRTDFLAVYTGDVHHKGGKKRSKITGLESAWTRKDNSVIDVIESVRVIHDNNGNFLYYEGTVTDITRRKKIENKLNKSRESLRKLTERLQEFREEERTEIAREIHDEFAQLLTGMAIDLSWVKKRLSMNSDLEPCAEIISRLDNVSELVDESFESVKKICSKLRPKILDDMGLEAAIRWQIDTVTSQSDIDFEFSSNIHAPVPDSAVATSLFRIFQECITNVMRHSRATWVRVNLRKRKEHIVLRVRDNGIGITNTSACGTESLGLVGIRERAQSLSGEVRIKGAPGRGTVVLVRIPYVQEAE